MRALATEKDGRPKKTVFVVVVGELNQTKPNQTDGCINGVMIGERQKTTREQQQQQEARSIVRTRGNKYMQHHNHLAVSYAKIGRNQNRHCY
jgi:hypothetical protein